MNKTLAKKLLAAVTLVILSGTFSTLAFANPALLEAVRSNNIEDVTQILYSPTCLEKLSNTWPRWRNRYNCIRFGAGAAGVFTLAFSHASPVGFPEAIAYLGVCGTLIAPSMLPDTLKMNFVDEHGETPLLAAIQNENLDMVRILIEGGNANGQPIDLNLSTDLGTPLRAAVAIGFLPAVEFLLESNASWRIQHPVNELNLIHELVLNPEMVVTSDAPRMLETLLRYTNPKDLPWPQQALVPARGRLANLLMNRVSFLETPTLSGSDEVKNGLAKIPSYWKKYYSAASSDPGKFECPFCWEDENATLVVAPCGHMVCEGCASKNINRCIECRKTFRNHRVKVSTNSLVKYYLESQAEQDDPNVDQ